MQNSPPGMLWQGKKNIHILEDWISETLNDQVE